MRNAITQTLLFADAAMFVVACGICWPYRETLTILFKDAFSCIVAASR